MAKPDRILADALSRLDRDTVLADILGNGLINVLLVSLEGKVVFANEACCRMVGRERADPVACSVDELVQPDDREMSRRDRHAVATGDAGSRNVEQRYVRRDGRIAWAKGSVSLLRDKETAEPLMLAYLLS